MEVPHTASMKASVQISKGIESLFGTRDENIRLIESGLGVSTHLQDSVIEIQGEAANVTRAERILEEHEKVIQDDKRHKRPPHALVSKIFVDRGYGFLEDGDGREVYFHRNSVLDGKFERLTVGTKVRFAEEDGDKGPQASTVHVLE